MEIQDLLASYFEGYDDLQDALRDMPIEMWDFKPGPDKWSVREIIIHLLDSEVNSYVRFRKIIAENSSTVMPYDQDKWANNLNYSAQSIDTSLELFKYLRLINFTLFKDIPVEAWNNFMMHPERGKISLYEHLQETTEHVGIHIKQMKRNYENWQKFKKS